MRLVLASLALLLAPFPAAGQSCPPGSTALVLSGGGAKGLAHIGVLQALDSLGIRPDFIVGSSIGAIIGGLYASGYSAREIDSLARNLPLTRMFRTYEPRVPFSLGLLQPAIVWEDGAGGLVLQRATVLEAEVNALLNAGFLRGNLMARGNFDSIPIPFRAVATDLLSGDPVILASGDLAQAVRASAAIPLLFEPEQIEGRYLGDGGLSANLPIGVARGRGATRVIVSVTTEPMADSLNLRSTFVLIDHLIGNLFRQPSDSLGVTDLLIGPDVEGFQSLDFSTPAINALISRGFNAAIQRLEGATCLPRRPPPPPPHGRPVLQAFSVANATPGDSAIFQRLLRLVPGQPIDIRGLQGRLRRLGSSDQYSSVWLFPHGSRDSVSFRITANLAPARVIGIGAVYDNDLGGRVWLGQVNRHVFRRNLEISSGAFFGELQQELFSRVYLTSVTGPAVAPTIEFGASRELVRRFSNGDERSPLKVHEGVVFGGVNVAWAGDWHGSLGVEGRLWDVPGDRGQASWGPRLTVLKAGRMAEPLFRLEGEANSEFQRLELEGIATASIGRLQLRPHLRYGLGETLPVQRGFLLGGVDGFAGRHIGELRSERELFGSLILLYPLKGHLLVRIEPMLGATGGSSGVLPEGDPIAGIRIGLNLVTGLGPVRVEYGISDGGRDGLLVRLGRWF